LWDVMTNQDVVDFVRRCEDPYLAAEDLVLTAIKLGSRDNITVLVVWLNWGFRITSSTNPSVSESSEEKTPEPVIKSEKSKPRIPDFDDSEESEENITERITKNGHGGEEDTVHEECPLQNYRGRATTYSEQKLQTLSGISPRTQSSSPVNRKRSAPTASKKNAEITKLEFTKKLKSVSAETDNLLEEQKRMRAKSVGKRAKVLVPSTTKNITGEMREKRSRRKSKPVSPITTPGTEILTGKTELS